jgi:hypothetical protein
VIAMKVGDLAKYRNTGSVGKIEDIKEEEGRTWALLDTTNLYYDVSTLVPAKPEEYRKESTRDRSLEDQLEEVNRLREQIEDIQAKASQITPSGGG